MKKACLISLSALWMTPVVWAAGLEGQWQGNLDVGLTKFRVALVLQKASRGKIKGTFNNIDDGLYGLPLQKLRTDGAFLHAKLKSGEGLELQLSADGSALDGNYIQAHGHFQKEGKTSALHLTRGVSFLVPRIGPNGKAVKDYVYTVPQKLEDGWEIGDLRESVKNIRQVEGAVKKILSASYPRIHSLQVTRHGKLVLDEYFYGYGPSDPHPLQSITKSVFSILFGIAQDQKFLQLNQKLYDGFPLYRSGVTWQAEKNKITLKMLLTMTSGFNCDDWKAKRPCSWQMVDSPDWVDFSLSQYLSQPPGTHFSYCGACLTSLSALLDRYSGMSVPAFAQQNLWAPLGIPKPVWMEGPGPVTPASFGLSLRPRDLAKIGQLVLNQGKWGEKQIVSADWIQESTSIQIPKAGTNEKDDYGYLWWERNLSIHGETMRVVYAWGVGGNYLFIVPKLELVCVVTAGNYDSAELGANSFKLFQDQLLGAVF
ncbi:MAG TPA: serine hydrolase [bacterium]|nr:serine hydrolase [bacterium]